MGKQAGSPLTFFPKTYFYLVLQFVVELVKINGWDQINLGLNTHKCHNYDYWQD